MHTIAYTENHIDYIKLVLAKNQSTIEALTKIPLKFQGSGYPGLTQEVKNEISTCIRILETEYKYVP